MCNIFLRIKKAFITGGIREVVRKTFYGLIYKINNLLTFSCVVLSPLKYGLRKTNNSDERIIVSLTSYPKRFDSIYLCLKSLLLQNYKPDMIIVYLGNDTKESDLTIRMKKLESYGIKYRIDSNNNFKSHKKYFYSMQEFPNDIIVTADDDLIYPRNWLKTMIKTHQKYPNCIVCRRTHLIRQRGNEIMPYNTWFSQWRKVKEPSYSLLGTSGSGKLYPPKLLCAETFNYSKFMSICDGADDIWIKCMEVISGVKVVWARNLELALFSTLKRNAESLENNNVTNSANDIYLKNVMAEYGLSASDFFKI